MRALAALALALGLVLAGPAMARDDRGDRGDRHHDDRGHAHGTTPVPAGVIVPTWDALTPDQQQALARLREDWDELPASRRVRALEWVERKARWEAMTPEQREKLRSGARNFRDLPPELRAKMRASMQAMRALPEDEQRDLRKRWHGMTPEARRAWLQTGGPGISPPPGDSE
ncbi:MAG TPA: DUF3106 domain-containing protein [Arenimonas sp.]|uniref:DUF3106 domain-containing protein n=1 Tax=Arenimonas sp. TaxID=1872635 RepID=UPI002D80F4AC|nr:DUF3106 domain-containing protein [Arenimonas sp.]HEU0152569.1 DUF3106 domain-containing protein [Arenimonas sp.]